MTLLLATDSGSTFVGRVASAIQHAVTWVENVLLGVPSLLWASLAILALAFLLVAYKKGWVLRSYEHLRRRLRRSGTTVWGILVVMLAVGITTSIAVALGSQVTIVAGLAALFTVSSSIAFSLREGGAMLFATFIGLLCAEFATHYLGFGPLGLAVVVGLALVAGRALNLGDHSVQVAATSLVVFALGTQLTNTLMVDRLMSTMFGVVIGVLLSPLYHPSSPATRAERALSAMSTSISELLATLSEGVRDGYGQTQAGAWLQASRNLDESLLKAREEVEAATGQARLSPFATVTNVSPLAERLLTLEHSAQQVNSIARAVFDATAIAQVAGANVNLSSEGDPVSQELSVALEAAGNLFAVQASEISGESGLGAVDEAAQEARVAQLQVVDALRNADDTGIWLLSGAILSDLSRMVDQQQGEAPALGVDAPSQQKDVIPPLLPDSWFREEESSK